MDTFDDPILTGLSAHLGADAAEALLNRINGFSNQPNAIKGMAKSAGDPPAERAALALVEDTGLAVALGLAPSPELEIRYLTSQPQEFWGLLTLAARADLGVVDRMAGLLDGDANVARKLATIRRAAAKHAADLAKPPARVEPGPDVPQKVSEVKRWLAAHPDVDPTVLAPGKGQKAAARTAAIRALGTIATRQALTVLGHYAQDKYPDAVLDELHKAWGNFDRREFAATMFRQAPYTLDLGVAPSIEGIGAVPDLTSLDVVLTDGADLTPLAECTGLRTLRVGAEGLPGLLGVDPILGLPELTELHLTRTTRNADLSLLVDLPVRQMRLDLDGADGAFLLDMPALESLRLAGDPDWDDPRAADPDATVAQAKAALADVVLELVRQGVRVAVYKHQRSWVTGLLERAEAADDILIVDRSGYVGLTNDEAALESIGRHLFANLLP
ncbi:hypothetical protein OCAE111667_14805 [Occultella aeris]|uniref:Uncharacterized protein n=1 Tax=Occultella aeris TaxID=2761496 RepID=A0A7M4DEW6_9MICO|nr:hypothetical protein [Occultella aeris]VZO35459.1 hypothetical protein HALOF300_00657 [Occultella aeris]